ncbi:peroxiredoxin [Oligoflexaceae bacterium]|nr:peroxiredoxin [Oligoflexaceae bacterium]
MKIGDCFPEFDLPDKDGVGQTLGKYLGQKKLVIFFYPKDFTAICTLEAKAFRDRYDEFQSLGAEIIGISSDDAESHKKFCDALKLPFPLLTDSSNSLRNSLVKTNLLTRALTRVTFVIGLNGEVLGSLSSALQADAHVKFALKTLADR